MTADDPRRCAICGARLTPGAKQCPRGHPARAGRPAVESNDHTAVAPVAGAEEHQGEPRPADEGAETNNTLFECSRCERLVETQYHRGVRVDPRFCPWCGRAVSSLLGREIGGYRLERIAASGGFGVLYVASNAVQPRIKAAVKFLHPKRAYESPYLARVFVEEARLTEEIGRTCWNVVHVRNVGEKPWPHYTMEYLTGRTLRDLLRTTAPGKLPLEDCKGYLRGIARALAATHSHGKVHRDLKPENLMVLHGRELPRAEDRIKLVDFGLAVKAEVVGIGSESQPQGLKRCMRVSSSATDSDPSPLAKAGTPEYMAPESFEGLSEARSDLYSFGVTAWEILTGELPWDRPVPEMDRAEYWRHAHREVRPRNVRELRREIPRWLARGVMRCLAKDPADRVGSAEELLLRLREPVPRWVWLASAAAVVLVALLGWFAWHPTMPPLPFKSWTVEARATEGIFALSDLDGSGDLTRDEWESFRERFPGAVPWDAFGLERSGDGKLEREDFLAAGRVASRSVAAPLRVRDMEHLTDLEVLVAAPEGKAVNEVEAASPGLEATLTGGGSAVRLHFKDDPSLLGSTLVVRALGKGLRLEGKLGIVQDGDPPVVGPLRCRALDVPRGSPPDLTGERAVRLGRQVELLALVEDQNLLKAFLELEPLAEEGPARPRQAVPTRAEPGTREHVFPLRDLEEGLYRARVVALDEAANVAEGPPVKIHFDEHVQLTFLRPEEPDFVASRRAFYELTAGEPLATIAVQGLGELKVFERPDGNGTALDLARKLQGQHRVDLLKLKKGTKYLLKVPVDAEEQTFELQVKDTSWPANAVTKRLVFVPPAPLGPSEIRAGVLLEGENNLPGLVLKREEGEGGKVLFSLQDPTSRTRLEKLELRFDREWVERAEWDRPGGEAARAEMEPQTAVFGFQPPLELERDRANRFDLRLWDPLERELAVTVVLQTDTTPPDLEIKARFADKYHRARTWADVRVSVVAKEPLVELSATLVPTRVERIEGPPSGSQNVPGAATDASGLSWTLSLDALDRPPAEGTYELTLRALDRARNEGQKRGSLEINRDPPRVTVPGGTPEKALSIESDKLLLQLEDPNGVDLTRTIVGYLLSGEDKPGWLRFGPANGPFFAGTLALRFPALTADCTGTLLVWAQDRLGLRHEKEKPLTWKFRYRRPRVNWRPEVSWSGIDWVRFQAPGGGVLYMSRTEISNRMFMHPEFIRDGRYVDETLRERYGRPRYWGPDGSLPRFRKRDGTEVPGDGFPVVGISPEEAEAFARAVLGGRLPTWKEWRAAAWLEKGERYPWRDVPEAQEVANCYGAWERGGSAFASRDLEPCMYCMDPAAGEKRVRFKAVEVAFDPLAKVSAEVRGKLQYEGKLLHLIGNVRELVRAGDGHAVAGGDFESNYDSIDLGGNSSNPMPYSGEGSRTGFRVVIDPLSAEARREFLERARDEERRKER